MGGIDEVFSSTIGYKATVQSKSSFFVILRIRIRQLGANQLKRENDPKIETKSLSKSEKVVSPFVEKCYKKPGAFFSLLLASRSIQLTKIS
jgi:hypothetical protein